MFNEVLPRTKGANSFTPRDFRNAREGVTLCSWPGELLKVREILNDNALLLHSDGTWPILLLQEEDPFAILVLAAMQISLVLCEIIIVEKTGVVA